MAALDRFYCSLLFPLELLLENIKLNTSRATTEQELNDGENILMFCTAGPATDHSSKVWWILSQGFWGSCAYIMPDTPVYLDLP